MLRRPMVGVAGLLAVAVGACAPDGGSAGAGGGRDPDRVQVVAAFYPLQFVAERVGGDPVSVTGLAPPGVEAHDLELTPSQVADIAEADLVIYLSGFQPAADAAVAAHARLALDVAEVVPLIDDGEGDDGDSEEGHGHGEADPHLWLDPDRLATIAGEVAASLGDIDAARAGEYTSRGEELGRALAALDTEYAEGLADCERREIVVSHAAFAYLADRYHLEQISLAGLSPEEEPTPQRLAELIAQAEQHGATTIFFEVLVSPRVAEVIAEHAGARTAVLDPIEGLAPGSEEDYFSLMRANLDRLRAALACS